MGKNQIITRIIVNFPFETHSKDWLLLSAIRLPRIYFSAEEEEEEINCNIIELNYYLQHISYLFLVKNLYIPLTKNHLFCWYQKCADAEDLDKLFNGLHT